MMVLSLSAENNQRPWYQATVILRTIVPEWALTVWMAGQHQPDTAEIDLREEQGYLRGKNK